MKLKNSSDQAVLQRNDQFLTRFVEAHQICPFARSCRENGRLQRQIVRGDLPKLQQDLLQAMVGYQDSEATGPEVVLLICPEFMGTYSEFERLVRAAHEQWRTAVAGQPIFYAVAFHRDLPFGAGSPQRLVGFWRHTPDPTVQLVRVATLLALRDHDGEPIHYVDPRNPADLASLAKARPTLSERIALANLQLYTAHGEALQRVQREILDLPRD